MQSRIFSKKIYYWNFPYIFQKECSIRNEIIMRSSRNLTKLQCLYAPVQLCNHGLSVRRFCDEPRINPIHEYERRVAAGVLQRDDYQLRMVEKFEKLAIEIRDFNPPKTSPLVSFFKRFMPASKPRKEKRFQPRGIYLYGSVGCGKTMLMDLFHDCCPTVSKERIHFHAFMNNVHKAIHDVKINTPRDPNAKFFDPIPPVAQQILDRSWLLCFDEFQVTDIADAMILKRLFEELWQRGLIMVATSNRPPDELYRHGLQRSNFLPFIDVLKEYCDCVALDSGIDYRRASRLAAGQLYFIGLEADTDKEMDVIFKKLSSRETDIVRPRTLNVFGRHLEMAKTCGAVLDAQFSELCDRPLGAGDYIVLSQVFHTVLIRNVPVFGMHQLGVARRFITMIDTFYDHKVRVVCSARAHPDRIFKFDSTSAARESVTDQQRLLMDDLKITQNDPNASASIFTGMEEIFAVDRTISRLMEMQSEKYWQFREPSGP